MLMCNVNSQYSFSWVGGNIRYLTWCHRFERHKKEPLLSSKTYEVSYNITRQKLLEVQVLREWTLLRKAFSTHVAYILELLFPE